MSFAFGTRQTGVPGRDIETKVVLVRGDDVVATWPLPGAATADLSVVDELARLQLAARRLGCSIRLRDACGQLWALIDLAGLADVVQCADGSVVEVSREAEGVEQGGVEE